MAVKTNEERLERMETKMEFIEETVTAINNKMDVFSENFVTRREFESFKANTKRKSFQSNILTAVLTAVIVWALTYICTSFMNG